MKCPLCQNEAKLSVDKVKDFLVLNGKSDDNQIWYCSSCEIGFSTPFLSERELLKSYPDEYEAYQRRRSIKEFLLKMKYKQDLKLIKKNSRFGASIFEIGSGRGEFLAEAKKKGFEVSGLEISETGRRMAKQSFEIELESGSGNKINFAIKYDVVILRHVLEHLESPYDVLNNIFYNGLKDGGIIFIKIPKMDSWEARFFEKYWHGYDLPRHRFHFTRNGMYKLLNKIGFKEIKLRNEIVYSDVIRSINYCNLTEKEPKVFKFFKFLPEIVQIFLAQIICYLFSFRGAGRMIIIARK